ncbi:vomeronasal type-2 receptor 1-like [Amia ocellicauda]|uniref:vomeronasal type-2 receptor 1-like n=1 Tax=Amia ocellicauda TaxID=2972642 RepID=UPI0034643CFE
MTTDASKQGWGAVCEAHGVRGRCTEPAWALHINVLELQAVLLGLSHFLPVLRDRHVLVRTDNIVVYINRSGEKSNSSADSPSVASQILVRRPDGPPPRRALAAPLENRLVVPGAGHVLAPQSRPPPALGLVPELEELTAWGLSDVAKRGREPVGVAPPLFPVVHVFARGHTCSRPQWHALQALQVGEAWLLRGERCRSSAPEAPLSLTGVGDLRVQRRMRRCPVERRTSRSTVADPEVAAKLRPLSLPRQTGHKTSPLQAGKVRWPQAAQWRGREELIAKPSTHARTQGNMQVGAAAQPTCTILENFDLYGLYRDGDILFGGILEIHFTTIYPELSFHSKPEQLRCEGFDFAGFQWAQAISFAIEEINRDPALLPNITLGYRMFDNCVKLAVAFRAATALISGVGNTFTDYSCTGTPPVLGIVGDPGSTHSIAISRMLGLFRLPLVSYYATCSCLSNKEEYPSFFRTIPSDKFQVKAMVQILRYYGWTWVGAIASNDDYGLFALKNFVEEVNKFGCVAFSEILPRNNDMSEILKIIDTIKQSTAKIIVVFSTEAYLFPLAEEIVRQNIRQRQWIASEAWTTSVVFQTKELLPYFGGTIGIAIRRGEMPGFEQHLLQVRPVFDPANNLVIKFWEAFFECKFKENTGKGNSTISKICTGSEDIISKKNEYNDVSELRATYNVYKAVYAFAHSLHDLMSCESGKGPFENNSCADITRVQPWQLLHYLGKVNFTTHYGDRVSFDENGDALAIYDVMNWQRADDGSVKIETIGLFDESAPAGQELTLQEDKIFWNFYSKRPPRSVCSESCLPGTRKATRKGEPLCCFDCIPCAEGEISNETDSIHCYTCPPEFWSNPGRNQCVLKEIEFLSYEEPLGISLTTISIFGACNSIGVLVIFFYYRNTPVVKANNSELSFLLLLSLILCFLCSLLFIGQPLHLTCMLRHIVFGISFVLCISCILVKTIVVIMAFKATLPDNNVMKWFGAAQQRGTVFVFTVIQAVICIIWLSTASPVPFKNTKYQNSKIIFECNIGSITGFSCLLGYIGLLASVCFLLAFLARNLPDTFNEAKYITFSMLIFCAVWIAFVPAYVSSPGKYSDAVEIFAILASSFGLLISIFAPKCYIILLRPEKNSKKALMGRAAPKQ